MQDTLLTIFTGVVALALLVQSCLFLGIYKSVRRLSTLIEGLSKDLSRDLAALYAKADNALSSIKSVVDGLDPIKSRITETTAIVHKRVEDLDRFLAEATSAGRLEIIRIQDMINTTSSCIEQIFDHLHSSILAPLSEISAVLRGFKVGADMLFRRRKGFSSTSSQDEEMFI